MYLFSVLCEIHYGIRPCFATRLSLKAHLDNPRPLSPCLPLSDKRPPKPCLLLPDELLAAEKIGPYQYRAGVSGAEFTEH